MSDIEFAASLICEFANDRRSSTYISALVSFERYCGKTLSQKSFNPLLVRCFLQELQDGCPYREYRITRRAILKLWRVGYEKGWIESEASIGQRVRVHLHNAEECLKPFLLSLVDDKHRDAYADALRRFEDHLRDRVAEYDFSRLELGVFLNRLRDNCPYREYRRCRRALRRLWQLGFDAGVLEEPPSVD